MVGGSSNTGPVAYHFFAYCNRAAICSITDEIVDRKLQHSAWPHACLPLRC